MNAEGVAYFRMPPHVTPSGLKNRRLRNIIDEK